MSDPSSSTEAAEPPPKAKGSRLPRSWVRWMPLVVPLLATLVGALMLDRNSWRAMVGDEPTYAMQAASLAFDFDLAYERRDFDRFVAHWRRLPENLILQSRDGGETITYGKPFLYALVLAPWLWLSVQNGAAILNALLLAAAGLVAARTLERRLGPTAPLWISVCIFASVAFAYTFWLHADLFLMATTALALALALRTEPMEQAEMPEVYDLDLGEPRRRFLARWLAVGALLAVPVAVRPFHAVLLPAVALAVPSERRRSGILALFVGAAALLGGAFALQSLAGSSYMGYGSERQGFYSYTGFPDVDFPRQQWGDSVTRWGNTSWIHEESLDFELDGRLWAWNGLYLVAGQSVGLLPYFLPVAFGLLLLRGAGGARLALVLAAAAVCACFLLIRPFNFWGGSGALANRYFLPLYPIFWFLPSRPMRSAVPLAAAVLAALFLWPLWLRPLAYPFADEGGLRHVTQIARDWLPYETTQSHLKPAGREDVNHYGLWVKFINRGVWSDSGGARLRLAAGKEGRLLVGSAEPLAVLRLELEGAGAPAFEVDGGEIGDMLIRPDGGVGYEIRLAAPRARHPMWWTWDPFLLYELRLRFPGAEPPAGDAWGFTLRRGSFREM